MNDALNQMMNELQQIRANNDTGRAVSPQEEKYLAQGLRAVGIKANPPTISNQEMQMFNEMVDSAANNFISPIDEMRALQQKGGSGADFLSNQEIARFQQLQNQNNGIKNTISLEEMINKISFDRDANVQPVPSPQIIEQYRKEEIENQKQIQRLRDAGVIFN